MTDFKASAVSHLDKLIEAAHAAVAAVEAEMAAAADDVVDRESVGLLCEALRGFNGRVARRRSRNTVAVVEGRQLAQSSVGPNFMMPKPNYDEWTDYPTWTLIEATDLAAGYARSTAPVFPYGDPYGALAPSRDELYRRVQHAIRAGDLGDPVSPPRFIDWLDSIKFSVPAEMRKLVEQKAERYRATSLPDEATKVSGSRSAESKKLHKIQTLLVHFLVEKKMVDFDGFGPPKVNRTKADKLGLKTKEWGSGITGKPIKEHGDTALEFCWASIWFAHKKSGPELEKLLEQLAGDQRS